jgi:hypothetical protein
MKLEQRYSAESTYRREWRSRVGRTLGYDPELAQQKLREDIQALLVEHRLAADSTITAHAPRTIRTTDRDREFYEAQLSVSARGSLSELVSLLEAIYERPYLVQVSTLILDAGDTEPKQTSRSGRSPGELSLTMKVGTLTLPDIAPLGGEPIGDVHALPTEIDANRLAFADEGYGAIQSTNIFGFYHKPPPPQPPRVEPEKPEIVERPSVTPPVDPRANADKFFMVGATSIEGEYRAYVQDRRNRDIAPHMYRPGDDIDDGVLLLVHPLGMVVAVDDDAGPVEYVYPIGKSFMDREPLDAASHPNIFRAFQMRFGVG